MDVVDGCCGCGCWMWMGLIVVWIEWNRRRMPIGLGHDDDNGGE